MPAIVAAEAVTDLIEAGVVTEGSMAATAVAAAVSIATSVTLSFGIGLIEQLLTDTPKPPKPHARHENFRQPLAPRVKYYGRVPEGGLLP